MKKISFSLLLIGTFAAYALFVQQKLDIDDDDLPIRINKQSASTTSQGSSETLIQVAPPAPVTETQSPTAIPAPARASAVVAAPPAQTPFKYRDGTYTGDVVDAYYGNVQVAVVIINGKIIDVQFLDHPQGRDQSNEINNYAMPILRARAISAQSAVIDAVSGASATSPAFIQSLTSALVQATL